mgnify:CR=1 FL=1
MKENSSAVLEGLMNYPFHYTLRKTFSNENMYSIWTMTININYYLPDFNATLSFLDEHDNDWFLKQNSNTQSFHGALFLSLFMQGIPTLYYGTERQMRETRGTFWTEKSTETAKLV